MVANTEAELDQLVGVSSENTFRGILITLLQQIDMHPARTLHDGEQPLQSELSKSEYFFSPFHIQSFTLLFTGCVANTSWKSAADSCKSSHTLVGLSKS